jgi:hypothetical protein
VAERFVRRSEPVTAIRWTGDNIEDVMAFMEPHRPQYMAGFSNADDLIGTPGGVASKGDYIVRRLDGTAGEIWPLPPEQFDARYRAKPEPVVPLSEVREALTEHKAVEALALELAAETGARSIKDGAGTYDAAKLDRARHLLAAVRDAAFPSTDSEGE